MTSKMAETLKRLLDSGSLTITTDRFAANKVNPAMARKLMDAGLARRGPGGAGNCNFIVPTDAAMAKTINAS
jgi:hypothetical protein